MASTTFWDPPPLAPGQTEALLVAVPGAELGDAAFCG
eukprot:SAG31_NODE_39072_length_291_cov_0.802083_1_plen_36_part_10